MKINLICGFFTPKERDNIIANSTGSIQFAADALQNSIIEGLSQNIDPNDICITNLPYIGSYPKRYKKFNFQSSSQILTNRNGQAIKINGVSFNNLSGYKLYSRYINCKHAISEWCKNEPDPNKYILIYAIHTPFIKACIKVKKKYPSLKIILIVPDLPEFMDDNKNIIKEFAHKCNEKILTKLYNQIDGYVLLSAYMTEKLPISYQKYTIVEGIYNPSDTPLIIQQKTNNTKDILYTGTLAKRYGIINLIKAFHAITDNNIRLIICGAGDGEAEIKQFAQKDNRIIFKGQLKREEILMLQTQSFLLVNPRTPEGEFTKYSFPSKTMEYLASGTPTLLYELPGIPNEYYHYCFHLKEISISALQQAIEGILSMDKNELKSIGERAKEFILNEKNPYKQCSKIIKLINSFNL